MCVEGGGGVTNDLCIILSSIFQKYKAGQLSSHFFITLVRNGSYTNELPSMQRDQNLKSRLILIEY